MALNNFFRRAMNPTLRYRCSSNPGGNLRLAWVRRYTTSTATETETETEQTTTELTTTTDDESLVQTIMAEIERAKETVRLQVPVGFPFKVEDQKDLLSINLSRKLKGEIIDVKVDMPVLVDDDEVTPSSSLPLSVRVSGITGHSLEFGCTAYPNNIQIHTLCLKDGDGDREEKRHILVFEEASQREFVKYLEKRGINSDTVNFLHDYMIKKDSMQHLMWLEKLKRILLKEDREKVSPVETQANL